MIHIFCTQSAKLKCPSTRHVFLKHGCPQRQQSQNMVKSLSRTGACDVREVWATLRWTYSLSLVIVWPPKLQILHFICRWDRITDRQTDRQSDYKMPRQTFQARGIKIMNSHTVQVLQTWLTLLHLSLEFFLRIVSIESESFRDEVRHNRLLFLLGHLLMLIQCVLLFHLVNIEGDFISEVLWFNRNISVVKKMCSQKKLFWGEKVTVYRISGIFCVGKIWRKYRLEGV